MTFDPGQGGCYDLLPWAGGCVVTFDPGQGEVL